MMYRRLNDTYTTGNSDSGVDNRSGFDDGLRREMKLFGVLFRYMVEMRYNENTSVNMLTAGGLINEQDNCK